MAVLKFRNQYLDRINIRTIKAVYMYEESMDQLCSYGLTIDFNDGSIEQYEYYNKWQRDKDFLNLNIKRSNKCSNKTV